MTGMGQRIGMIAVVMVLACGQARDQEWTSEASSIVVTVGGLETGSPDQPLDIAAQAGPFVLDMEVRSGDAGEGVLRSFNGWVRVSSRPGTVSLASDVTDVVGHDVSIVDGRASGIALTLHDVFGNVRVWAEDIGYLPPQGGSVSACTDGIDNDGDGLVDSTADMGCLDATDDSEEGGTYASGVSDPIIFRNPTLAEVQGKGSADPQYSPYEGEVVTVDHGDLVVTRVTRDGMYVTDAADPGGYNHAFVYNYNTPPGVRVCDRLQSLSGTIGEFYGFTEMNFPSWVLDPWYEEKGPCPLPEPQVITVDDLDYYKDLEPYEAALVRVEAAAVADFTVDCDTNHDGLVDFEDYDTGECSNECECRKSCQNDVLCTEMNQYREYGQWAVSVGGEKLWVVTRNTIPEFDPFGPGHPKVIASITGTLRNMSFLRPSWILEPRCPDDLVVAGEPPPVGDMCIYPRTGEEDEPN